MGPIDHLSRSQEWRHSYASKMCGYCAILCDSLNPLDCRESQQVSYSENLVLAERWPARPKGKEMGQHEGRLLGLLGFGRREKGPQIYLTGNVCCSSGKGAKDPTEGSGAGRAATATTDPEAQCQGL